MRRTKPPPSSARPRTALRAPAARRRSGRRRPSGPTRLSTAHCAGDQRRLDAEHEPHPLEEGRAAPRRCRARRRPRSCRRGRPAPGGARRARCGESTSASLPAPSASRSRCWLVRLCSQRQPVGAGDDEDVAVAAVDQPGALGEQALLAQRVAVVGGDGTALDDDAPGRRAAGGMVMRMLRSGSFAARTARPGRGRRDPRPR